MALSNLILIYMCVGSSRPFIHIKLSTEIVNNCLTFLNRFVNAGNMFYGQNEIFPTSFLSILFYPCISASGFVNLFFGGVMDRAGIGLHFISMSKSKLVYAPKTLFHRKCMCYLFRISRKCVFKVNMPKCSF